MRLTSSSRLASTLVLGLCCLMVVMGSFALWCPFCDEVAGGRGSAAHQFVAHHDHAPDSCTGVCSCCSFHVLPQRSQALEAFGLAQELSPPSSAGRPGDWVNQLLRPPRS